MSFFDRLFGAPTPEPRPGDDGPAPLAQSATRSELRQPGTMERSLVGPGVGPGFGDFGF